MKRKQCYLDPVAFINLNIWDRIDESAYFTEVDDELNSTTKTSVTENYEYVCEGVFDYFIWTALKYVGDNPDENPTHSIIFKLGMATEPRKDLFGVISYIPDVNLLEDGKIEFLMGYLSETDGEQITDQEDQIFFDTFEDLQALVKNKVRQIMASDYKNSMRVK